MTTPAKIGKYTILGTLGKGAMGEVYLGEDAYIGRRVAIKVMHDADPAAAERFRHEARIIGGFSHPHIVLLLEFGFEGEQPFLAMEYLEGESLEGWMRAPHALGEQLKLMSGLCSALAYAHARGVLHRDVKPSNVQVTPDGQCKLMDFGIAHAPTAKLTATGTIMGTPNYMAPEIVRDAAYSERSDLYSLAVVFYEMLSGRNPFVAGNVAACLHNVLYVVPASLRELRPDLPPALADAVDACLRKSPEERLAGVAVLGEVVDGLLAGGTTSAGRTAPARPGEETHFIPRSTLPAAAATPARGRRARPAWLVPGALAIVVALVAWVWLARRPSPSVEPVIGASASPSLAASAPVPLASAPAVVAQPSPSAVPRAATAAEHTRAAAGPSGGAPRSPSTPPATLPSASVAAAAAPVPTPTPSAPLVTLPAAPPPVERAAAPTPAPATVAAVALPELLSLKPRTVRVGGSIQLEIRGRALNGNLTVAVLHGRRPAPGIRVRGQRFVDATRIDATLFVDPDAAIDTYVLVLIDAAGRATNSLPIEVSL